MSIPFSVFYNPYRYKEVEPGKSAVIYQFKLPPEYVGFIYDLWVTWYHNTYLNWEIDNGLVEKIEREIGSLSKPKLFDPPYFVRDLIKFTAYNNDTEDYRFRVLCDGLLIGKIT